MRNTILVLMFALYSTTALQAQQSKMLNVEDRPFYHDTAFQPSVIKRMFFIYQNAKEKGNIITQKNKKDTILHSTPMVVKLESTKAEVYAIVSNIGLSSSGALMDVCFLVKMPYQKTFRYYCQKDIPICSQTSNPANTTQIELLADKPYYMQFVWMLNKNNMVSMSSLTSYYGLNYLEWSKDGKITLHEDLNYQAFSADWQKAIQEVDIHKKQPPIVLVKPSITKKFISKS